MKPINQEEFQNLETLIAKMENFPDSIRIFNELYKAGMNILKNKGEKKKYGYSYITDVNGKQFSMANAKIADKESIMISYPSKKASMVNLVKEKGCQTKKMIENHDFISLLLKGVRFRDYIAGFLNYEPSSLLIYDGQNLKITKYV